MSTRARERVRNLSDATRYRLQPSDPCILDRNPRRPYFVVGVLGGDELEIVAFAAIRDRALVDPDGFEDILDAVNDGRLSTVRCPRERALPLPLAMAREIDRDEVRR